MLPETGLVDGRPCVSDYLPLPALSPADLPMPDAERPVAVKLQARSALPRRIARHHVGASGTPLHGTFRYAQKPAARAWLPGRRAR